MRIPRRLTLAVVLFAASISLFPTGSGLIHAQDESAIELYPIVKHGKWGYIDKTGKVVIKPQFKAAEQFSDGLGLIWTNHGNAYVDRAGKVVIGAPALSEGWFNEGLAAINIGDQHGYIDKMGKVVLRSEFDDVGDFSDGV